jgi:hypothetical protein
MAQQVRLRGNIPRTAVISVPAYGINIHSEREVVVAGVNSCAAQLRLSESGSLPSSPEERSMRTPMHLKPRHGASAIFPTGHIQLGGLPVENSSANEQPEQCI